ncbi:hypothetical protein J2X13_004974 [Aminobacter aminovorans]|nr:hypothetical protein [Aminobacter aminovorans]MDR7224541.1 hypothetical protein [Aminobacter aminovorans]
MAIFLDPPDCPDRDANPMAIEAILLDFAEAPIASEYSPFALLKLPMAVANAIA